MRRRVASSGKLPVPAAMFSRTWATWLVAGMTQVTAGCDTMNLRMNWAQLDAPISADHGGGRPPGQGAEQGALLERPVDEDRDPPLLGQRQNSPFHHAVEDVVGDLHEVERAGLHDLLHLIVAPALGGGNADVAQLPFRLHLE